jgi:hypothetical protein
MIPSFGSVEGGTLLSIYGANFAPTGLFSQRQVYIGGAECSVINYFSSDTKLVCITPKCSTYACISSPTYDGDQKVSLEIYIQTVESILGVANSFTYSGSKSPFISKMSHTSWATATSYVLGYFPASYLEDIEIKFGGNFAEIGNPDELNGESISSSSLTTKIFYRPPEDASADFKNLSLTIAISQPSEIPGTGLARMFPIQKPIAYATDFTYDYNFDASLSGTVFSVCSFPTIASISPLVGSVSGGTILTILGHGFTYKAEQLVVYAGGKVCEVISAQVGVIQCKTSALLDDHAMLQSLMDKHSLKTVPTFNTHTNDVFNSSRSYGSPGWWIKMWSFYDYQNGNAGKESKVRLSIGLRQGLNFGFYYTFGNTWPTLANYDSKSSDPMQYAADYFSVLLAPYSGTYYFYMTSDDSAKLYGKIDSKTSIEALLLSTSYSAAGDFYVNGVNGKKSIGVALKRGERYHLRVRLVNTGGPDYLQLAMKIKLNYDATNGILADYADSLQSNASQLVALEQRSVTPLSPSFSNSFLRHHSLKDIQVLSLSIVHRQEIQVIIIDKLYY